MTIRHQEVVKYDCPLKRAVVLLCALGIVAPFLLGATQADARAGSSRPVAVTPLVKSIEVAGDWYVDKIHLPQAWQLTSGSPEIVIAIVDSGIDPHHPDLKGKLVAGYNAQEKNTNTSDQYGHGTKMAGVVAARVNQVVGTIGVARQSHIMPIRVTDRTGRARAATIASGLVWAVDHGARVINLSLEGVILNAEIRRAAEYAFRKGVLVVAPSGNCACVVNAEKSLFILSVAASDENDQLASLSTTGPFVSLLAPGVNITTTAMYGLHLADSGTSLASAVVTGVVALMLSVNPALSPDQLTKLLLETAANPAAGSNERGIGYRRVDAFAAVNAAKSYAQDLLLPPGKPISTVAQ